MPSISTRPPKAANDDSRAVSGLGGIARGPTEQDAHTVDDHRAQRQDGDQPDPVGQALEQYHRGPPRIMAGARASDSPANQAAERATCGSTAEPDHGSQPRRGQ